MTEKITLCFQHVFILGSMTELLSLFVGSADFLLSRYTDPKADILSTDFHPLATKDTDKVKFFLLCPNFAKILHLDKKNG